MDLERANGAFASLDSDQSGRCGMVHINIRIIAKAISLI